MKKIKKLGITALAAVLVVSAAGCGKKEEKVYKNKIVKQIVNMLMPKPGTKDFRKIRDLLKDSASKLKMRWLYINRITICIVTFIASFFLFLQLHRVSIDYVYTQPTTTYDILRRYVRLRRSKSNGNNKTR